jgi:hypothetical protein
MSTENADSHEQHRIYLTDCSAKELIVQTEQVMKNNKRIIIAVASNAMVDPVKNKLDKWASKSKESILSKICETKSYQHYAEHGYSYHFDEDSAPWTYNGKLVAFDEETGPDVTIKTIKRRKARKDDLFPEGNDDAIKIVILVNNVLFNPKQLQACENNNASVIFLNPSIDAFRNFHMVRRKEEGKTVERFLKRKADESFPVILENLDVNYIVESSLVTDLIQSSYSAFSKPIRLHQTSYATQSDHVVNLYVSDVASKRYSGVLPIVFEVYKKERLNKKGVLVGDGLAQLNNYNNVRSSITPIEVPVVVKVSQPHRYFTRNLMEQLGFEPKDEWKVKKAIILNGVKAVLRRTAAGQEIHFVCDRYTATWLGDIPVLKGLKFIETDMGKAEYQRGLDKGEINEKDNPLRTLLQRRYEVAITLGKSKSALDRYIKSNKVFDQSLEKFITSIMFTTTVTFREGVYGGKLIPEFEFEENSDVPSKADGHIYKKLVKLCAYALSKYAPDVKMQKAIFKRYDELMVDYKKSEHEKRLKRQIKEKKA